VGLRSFAWIGIRLVDEIELLYLRFAPEPAHGHIVPLRSASC
jgi:hypothetical protein